MIKFPKIHVATSVVNRILNVAEELESQRIRRQKASMPIAPNVPDPSLQGQQIDQALSTPLAPVSGLDGPESIGNNVMEAVLSGGTPLNGALDTVSGQ